MRQKKKKEVEKNSGKKGGRPRIAKLRDPRGRALEKFSGVSQAAAVIGSSISGGGTPCT